jgi:hypothetical protein
MIILNYIIRLFNLSIVIRFTYSVDSTVGVDGIIINIQFVRIVVMMNNEKSG